MCIVLYSFIIICKLFLIIFIILNFCNSCFRKSILDNITVDEILHETFGERWALIVEQIESENVSDKEIDCTIFTDSVKLSRNVIKKDIVEDMNKKLVDEVIVNDKFSSIDEADTKEDTLYKKLSNKFYKCSICEIIVKRKIEILCHLDKEHNYRPFKCVICSKSFMLKSQLKNHGFVHQEVDVNSLYSCSKCDFRSKWKKNFKKHIVSCNEEYQFICEYCGKRYKIKSHFKLHLSTHNDSQQSRRKVAYLNEYKLRCDKKLLMQENLDNRMQQHNINRTYDCKECGKEFASKISLVNHRRTHIVVEPCHVCKKSFKTLYMKKQHLITHSTEKPHTCDICGRVFKWKRNMVTHRKKHQDAHLSSYVPLGEKQ